MSAVAFGRTKNEADIVESWVRHTLSHVEHMVVSDDASDDRTLEILHALRDEGLSLEVRQENTLGYYQAQKMTSLMHSIKGFDWYLPLDADEFIQCEGRISDVLKATPRKVYQYPWVTHYLDSQKSPIEEPVMNKVILPELLAQTAALSQGSHFVWNMPATTLEGAHLAHIPNRSVNQIMLKVVVAHLQYVAMGADYDKAWGKHTRENFDQVLLGNIPDIYAPKPHNVCYNPLITLGGPNKYTESFEDRYEPCLIKYAMRLAKELGRRKMP